MTERLIANRLVLLSAAAKCVALFGFMLPWLTVAVGSRQVISATGLNFAMGEFSLRVPILGTLERHDAPLAVPIILAGILIATGLGMSLLAGRRRGALAGLLLSGIALLLIAGFVGYGLNVHMPLPPEQMSLVERLADSIVRQVVHARSGFGFWLTLIALVIAMLVDFSDLQRRGVRSK